MADDDLTANQCKQARQGLDWTRGQLSEASNIAERTILDFEMEIRQPFPATKIALKLALQNANVKFRQKSIVIPVIEPKKGAK